MTIYVSPDLNGITIEEAMKLTTLAEGFCTAKDVENLRVLSRIVIEDMFESAALGDLDRVEYLDRLYQDLIEVIDDLACNFDDDYVLD